MESKHRKFLGSSACIIIFMLLIVILILVATVYFSELQPQKPAMNVDGMMLEITNSASNLTVYQILLCLNLCLNVSLHNPNKEAFAYSGVQATVDYQGKEVGFLFIPGGEIRSKSTTKFTIFLTSSESSNLPNPESYSATNSHILTITTNVEISGEVAVLGSFTHHIAAATSCIVSISSLSKAVIAYDCGNT